MSAPVEKRFEQLLGRQPSDTERLALYRVRDQLAIADDDPVWTVVLALQWHLALYGEIPEQVATILRTESKPLEHTAKRVTRICYAALGVSFFNICASLGALAATWLKQ
ncbi:hypothetical protein [Burkholderia cepacia]|uniref:Uncharacterized protein n=1 Tax=Burkholderia cepacia TaxID=292 RepID=A0AAX2RRU7_BURCE|nr:hypothetical protein [Burkholderia cepacia]TET01680.1 hypothetical protein E3D36_16730 [Burkholderia cepacia]TEU47538.1 hypothetical protein E3D37_16160 [Burkholderia cepacia]TEU53565.1 hypothetical protein E3D38_12550 [Burkholderia cepacia]TEV02171.1 hypothetical protein E3D40_13480 [Burkholderia cepacia]TEV07982.1 hypothetical protein E3D44_19480 [Burkholderia cepacia]